MLNLRSKQEKANIGLSDMGKGLDVVRVFTCNAGNLIPIEYLHTIPGDILKPRVELIIRANPLLAPVMTPYYARTFFFHVPYALIWTNFENSFITGGELGNDSTVHPYITSPASVGYAVGSLGDYLAYPTGVASKQHSALKVRAYNEIWNWHFRNHDVQTTKAVVSKADGSDTTTEVILKNINWSMDYFTGLPWTQRGTSVGISLTGTADIDRVTNAGAWKAYNQGTNTLASDLAITTQGGYTRNSGNYLSLDPDGQLVVDLDSSMNISSLRTSFAKQNIFEILAKVGGFYTQWLRGILGFDTRDDILQIPEYLGSSTTQVLFTEVLQTAEGTNPVGTLRGHGITGDNVSTIDELHVKRHGILMALMAITPVAQYSQGWEKCDIYTTRWDYFHPQLEGLSLQPIYNKEIYAAHASPDGVFCYQDPYFENRVRRNSIHGKIKSTFAQYVADREFGSDPTFNSAFLTCTPATDIFAAPSEHQFIVQAKIVYDKALRKVRINPQPSSLK